MGSRTHRAHARAGLSPLAHPTHIEAGPIESFPCHTKIRHPVGQPPELVGDRRVGLVLQRSADLDRDAPESEIDETRAEFLELAVERHTDTEPVFIKPARRIRITRHHDDMVERIDTGGLGSEGRRPRKDLLGGEMLDRKEDHPTGLGGRQIDITPPSFDAACSLPDLRPSIGSDGSRPRSRNSRAHAEASAQRSARPKKPLPALAEMLPKRIPSRHSSSRPHPGAGAGPRVRDSHCQDERDYSRSRPPDVPRARTATGRAEFHNWPLPQRHRPPR